MSSVFAMPWEKKKQDTKEAGGLQRTITVKDEVERKVNYRKEAARLRAEE